MDAFDAAGAAVVTVFREDQDGAQGLTQIREQVGEGPVILGDLGAEQTAGYSTDGFMTYIIDPEGVVRAELDGSQRTRPDSEAILAALAEIIEADE